MKWFRVIWCDAFAGDILWLEGLNVQRTEMILGKLAKMLYEWVYEEQSVSRETIYGIEILNEPWGKYQGIQLVIFSVSFIPHSSLQLL